MGGTRKQRVASGLAVLLIALACRNATAGTDPAYQWQVLVTDHFRVHFYQGGENLARRAAGVAEEAWAGVQDFLGLVPTEIVDIVIADDTDAANGFTGIYPYDSILLLAWPPEPESELASEDDYLRTLVYHEYAHVAHLDHVEGVPAFLNLVLGKTAIPNAVTNTWLVEGIAVFVESHLTRGGRNSSSLYDMQLRAAALDDRLLTLPELTTTPMELPRGGAPYLYGSRFLQFLWERHGVEPLAAFIRDYGRRIVPYALNLLARRHWGRDFLAMYEDFLAAARLTALRAAGRVRDEGEVAGRLLTEDGEFNGYAAFTPDSRRILFVRSDGHSTSGVFEVDAGPDGPGELRRVLDCWGGCGHLAVDGESFLTTHLDSWRIYHTVGDVWRVDRASGEEQRLTTGARARDPSAGPDGVVFYASSAWGESSIVAWTPPSGAIREVLPPGRFQGLGDPRPIPGTDRLVFSGAAGGRWDLWTVDVTTGELAPVTDDECLDRDPAPTPDGRYVLFSSDRRGIYNLYARDLASNALYRVTNVVGGAFWPAVSPDGRAVAFSTYSSRGYDLAVLPLDPATWVRVDGTAGGGCRGLGPGQAPVAPSDVAAEEDWAWPSIRPRALRPLFRFATDGTASLGAEVVGSDAVGLHAFSLAFESRLNAWRPQGAATYSWNGWWPTLGLSLATWPTSATARVDDRRRSIDGRAWMVAPSISMPFPGRIRSFQVSLGYSLQFTTGLDQFPVGTDPAATRTRPASNSRFAGLTVAASHDSTEAYAWSISPARGFRTGVSATFYHRGLGSQGSAATVSAWFYEYLAMPWLHDHVLAVLWSGGLSRGDEASEDSFALGGFPPQDLGAALLNQAPMTGRYLRGFPAGLLGGNTTTLLNVEYRFPLWYIHEGLDTLPAAARRLWGVVFADGGGAWTGLPRGQDLRADVGAEAALSTSLFLSLDAVFRLGYSRGFGPGGMDVVYFLLTR